MLSALKQYLSTLGIAAVLGGKSIHGLLDVYLLDFLGSDEKFYSFLAIYNETQVFTASSFKIGEMDFRGDRDFGKNLRIFNTKKEWLSDHWCCKDADFLMCVVNKFAARFCEFNFQLENFSTSKVSIWFQPAMGFSITFTDMGVYAGIFTAWEGTKSIVTNNYEGYKRDVFCYFIEAIAFGAEYEWR